MITSVRNETIGALKAMRDGSEYYWWEGPRFAAEAAAEGARCAVLVIAGDPPARSLPAGLESRARRVVRVSPRVFAALAATDTPQGIGGLIERPVHAADKILAAPGPVFYLAGLQDPGNVGTIVRIADAFGFAGLLYEPGGVSPYAEKAVRGSAGSILRVACASVDRSALSSAAAKNKPVVLLNPRGEAAVSIAEMPGEALGRAVFVLGQEGRGVGFDLPGAVRAWIPMAGRTESLNVAVCAGIAAYLSAAAGGRRC